MYIVGYPKTPCVGHTMSWHLRNIVSEATPNNETQICIQYHQKSVFWARCVKPSKLATIWDPRETPYHMVWNAVSCSGFYGQLFVIFQSVVCPKDKPRCKGVKLGDGKGWGPATYDRPKLGDGERMGVCVSLAEEAVNQPCSADYCDEGSQRTGSGPASAAARGSRSSSIGAAR